MKFKCYLCGNTSAEVVADKKTIRFNVDKTVFKCLRCDLIQMYPNEELSYNGYSNKKDFKGHKIKIRPLPKWLFSKITPEMRILEVGCGNGSNISTLNSLGLNACGIDADPTCKGDKIVHMDWNDFRTPMKFDVIFGIHFLEHVSDPHLFLEWVMKNLKKNGRFLFEVPSVDDPLIKFYKNKAYNKFCWYPYHMFFYSKKTLESIFIGLDFNVIRKQEYGLINHLRWAIMGKPGNWNPNVRILDTIYKWVLIKLGYSDSLIVIGENV